ncbi:hypothetical protein G4V62_15455 [Bacillaceae bacterium SIJ1]|uniref:hypothetical protein n=1 Tax=Litoribacterium kuwaitense TaxID=1398745 RepID=UPI0013ED22D5|nr:hypothetical protein [Litoribacterium kuwaitense]NGP46272.1 hypothetical protein [Litoribacterium kuwaitense]
MYSSYSMIQSVRTYGHLLDRRLKRQMVRLYHPMRLVPCIFHRLMDHWLKKSKRVDVIVQFTEEGYESGLNTLKQKLGEKYIKRQRRLLPQMNGCALRLSMDEVEQLCHQCKLINKIYLDRSMSVLMDRAAHHVHAHRLRESGLSGKGVTVAIVDTGFFRIQI